MIKSVTVYCSSSRHVDNVYVKAATQLGVGIAKAGWSLVYGGNDLGLMKCIADAARAGGARVVGVTPRRMVEDGIGDQLANELIVVETMPQRKALLAERGDAFVVLPGGVGTLEELLEVLVGKLLGYHDKPIVLLNIDRFFEPLLALLDHMVSLRFAKATVREAFQVAPDVDTAIGYLMLHAAGELTIGNHDAPPVQSGDHLLHQPRAVTARSSSIDYTRPQ